MAPVMRSDSDTVSLMACPNSRSRFFRWSSSCKGGLPYLCKHFRLTWCWIQARLEMLSPKCSQPMADKFVALRTGSAIHCARDSALRCCGGHIERRGAGNSSRNRISVILACFKAAFLRSDRRRVCSLGHGLAELRVPCVDTRRCALADRAGSLRGRAVWFLFCNAISSRTQNALTYVRDEITCKRAQRAQRAARTLHHAFRAPAGACLHTRQSARMGF